VYTPKGRRRHQKLELYELNNGQYQCSTRSEPFWLPEIGLGIGRVQGILSGISIEWLTWFDSSDRPYPLPEQRAEQEYQRAQFLAAKLRSLGIDPGHHDYRLNCPKNPVILSIPCYDAWPRLMLSNGMEGMEAHREVKMAGKTLNRWGRSLWVGSLMAWVGFSPGVAQEVLPRSENSPMSLFRTVTLTPGFDPDPFEISGISGGTVAAATIANRLETETGICGGYVSERPDYELVLTEDFSYLNLQVFSPQDTMLLIQGPGGTWCSDDVYDWNPSIAGQWLEGTYRVWVGSVERDQYIPYDLNFSEVR